MFIVQMPTQISQNRLTPGYHPWWNGWTMCCNF